MNPKTIELWTWVLIFGGLLALSLGWFVAPYQGPWGELLFSGGMLATAGGVVLIYVRSRMEDSPP